MLRNSLSARIPVSASSAAVATLLAAIGVSGCTVVSRDQIAEGASASAVRAAIEARDRAFEACFAKRDAECVVTEFYVSDALNPVSSGPGNQPPVRGRTALIKSFEEAFKVVKMVELEPIDIVVRGDMADELGRSHVSLQSGVTSIGRYSVVWLRDADGWRAKVDFFADDGWP